MSVMNDRWIIQMAKEKKMIEPFDEYQVNEGKISSGVSSYGYDFRLSNQFQMFCSKPGTCIDPKNPESLVWDLHEGDTCVIPPNTHVLARSLEYFRIPREVVTICFGKSTYARSGILVNVTPFEPEWEGFVTLSIVNTTSLPAKIYAYEGIAQVLFLKGSEVCSVSYQDRKGKYQGQRGITHSKI